MTLVAQYDLPGLFLGNTQRAVRRAGDPSYGTYLWAFPIQQTLISVWGPLSLPGNVLLVPALSLLAGYAPWHLLEKRAIALGGRLTAQLDSSQGGAERGRPTSFLRGSS